MRVRSLLQQEPGIVAQIEGPAGEKIIGNAHEGKGQHQPRGPAGHKAPAWKEREGQKEGWPGDHIQQTRRDGIARLIKGGLILSRSVQAGT